MSVVWSLTGTTVTDTTLYMFHTVNGCIMRVYWFYSLLSFSVVHSSSFFLAFITVAVVFVMDLVVWNKRGLDWIYVCGYVRLSVHLSALDLVKSTSGQCSNKTAAGSLYTVHALNMQLTLQIKKLSKCVRKIDKFAVLMLVLNLLQITVSIAGSLQ